MIWNGQGLQAEGEETAYDIVLVVTFIKLEQSTLWAATVAVP